MEHLGTVGQLVSLTVPLILIAVAWGKYSTKAKEHDADIERLYVKNQNIIDNCEVLKREYLSDSQHEMKCKVATMEIKQDIRDSADEIKDKVEETMVDFQKTMGEMFQKVLQEVKNNNNSPDPR